VDRTSVGGLAVSFSWSAVTQDGGGEDEDALPDGDEAAISEGQDSEELLPVHPAAGADG
jgi:hypothetical protein